MKKYKLLHIITGLNTGGAERALYNLLYGGIKDHFNCYVISLLDEGTYGAKIKKLGVPVLTIGIKRGIPSPASIYKLRQAIQKIQPDIIQGWMYHGNFAAAMACKWVSPTSRVIWNVRQSLYDITFEKRATRLIITFGKFLSKNIDTVIYNSRISRKQHEKFGFSPRFGIVIPNGIDTNRFKFVEENRIMIRNELAIPLETIVIGMIARFHPMKNHKLFLKAAVKIAQEFNHIFFVLAGNGITFNNSMLADLIPSDLRAKFKLIGERDDVAELLCAMDIVSSSSSYGEGFPNVIGEAMASELPCVVTDVGDCAYIVGDTGIIVPPRNGEELQASLVKMLSLPTNYRKKLGVNARLRIKEKFSLPACVERYVALYENLLGRNFSACAA